MNITVEKQQNCTANVRVQVPEATRKAARDAIVGAYARDAALPGFRKGKVPRPVVEKRFHDEIERELIDRLANDALGVAVKQENLRVLSVGGASALSMMPISAASLLFSLIG